MYLTMKGDNNAILNALHDTKLPGINEAAKDGGGRKE